MLRITLDTKDLDRAQRAIGMLTQQQIEWTIADAMTAAAAHAADQLRSAIPRYVDRPTPRTKDSVFSSKATQRRLAVAVGFKGSPVFNLYKQFQGFESTERNPRYPGGYLLSMVRGGARMPRSSERRLRAQGVLSGSRPALIPTDADAVRYDQYGNATAAWVSTVLSRSGQLSTAGFTANRTASTRSRRRQSRSDYWFGAPAGGAKPVAFQSRAGKRPSQLGTRAYNSTKRPKLDLPRGYETVMMRVRQPNYRPTFPVSSILERAYGPTFSVQFETNLSAKLKRYGFSG
jgi:hypothetical protein